MRLTDDWYVSSTLLWTRRMLTACVTIIVPTFAGNLQLQGYHSSGSRYRMWPVDSTGGSGRERG